MSTILGVIIALGVLIAIHEGGHYAMARLLGVHVEKFSLGFGPRLFGWRRGDTDYRISLIPLGGYVKMRGENPDEASDEPGSFTALPWWGRASIAVAGPLANALLAVLVFIFSYAMGRVYDDQPPVVGTVDSAYVSIIAPGDSIVTLNGAAIDGWSRLIRVSHESAPDTVSLVRGGEAMTVVVDSIGPLDWYTKLQPHVEAVIGEVMPGLPAYQAGLQSNDRVLAVDDVTVSDWYDMRERIMDSGDRVKLTIERGGGVIEPEIALDSTLAGVSGKLIGVTQFMPLKIKETYTLGEAVVNGALTAVYSVTQTYSGVVQLIANPRSLKSNIGSPVMLAPMGNQMARRGFGDLLFFVGAISMLLAIMNLLPIPILDGGQIFFCLIEGVIGKPLPLRVQGILQQIGLALLLFLMIFAIYNDVTKVVSRGMSLHEQSQTIGE